MPMIEILSPHRLTQAATQAAPSLCGALSGAWGIPVSIVTVYVVALPDGAYVHAGEVEGGPARLFVKLHAFRRTEAARQAAATALTACFAQTGIPAKDVILYFIDRSPDEVAHDGTLQRAHP